MNEGNDVIRLRLRTKGGGRPGGVSVDGQDTAAGKG